MRSYRWMLALIVLALVATVAPAQAQSRIKNNIVVVNPFDDVEEKDLLPEAEVEKIDRLQNDVTYLVPFSPVSPDDQAVLVIGSEELGFLDINDGSTTAIDVDSFGPIIPLPLLGFSSFNWVDSRTLGALSLNFAADSFEEAFVVLLIDRVTQELSGFQLSLPENTDILSVSPDFTKYVLVQYPEQEESEEFARETSMQLTWPRHSPESKANPRLPAAYQRMVDRAVARNPQLLNRVQLMQDTADDGSVDITVETVDLVRWDAVTEQVGYLTTLPVSSLFLGEAWSKDSAKLAMSWISLNDPDAPRSTFDGALLSEIFYRDVTGNLKPSENPLIQGNNTYIVDMNSGAVSILRAGGEAAPPLLEAHSWSTDSKTLMTRAWHPGRVAGRTYPVYFPQFSERISFRFYNAQGGEVSRFEPAFFDGGSGPIGAFVSPDEVIFRVSGVNRHPYYYNRASGEFRNIADRAGSYYNVVTTNRSRQIVYVYTSFSNPPEIYRMGLDGKGVARLTWFNEELRQYAGLREDPVSFRLANGKVRSGTLVQAAGAAFPPRNTRLIVWQEGGPGGSMTNEWNTIVERPYSLLPTFGYAVLVMPLAGRAGYDAATYNSLADRGNFGQIDIDEQAEVVRQMIKGGWTSAGKIGITGCSYGGYFVWQSIIRHPDLYSAANAQCALVDNITEWSRGYAILMPYLMGPPPFSNQAEYRNDSPIYNANKVKTPVLTFHGSEDFLPVVQNENLHLLLVNRGVPARMVKVLGEGHGFGDPANQLYAAQEQLTWFRTYLK